MSYITFSPNQVVYIRGLGYATLLNCGNRPQIAQKVDQPDRNSKQSLVFDPDLFASDPDSRSKSDEERNEKKPEPKPAPESPPPKEESEPEPPPKPEAKEKEEQEEEPVNLIQARLEGCNAIVSTSDKNLTKSILVQVKPFIGSKSEQVEVQVQITKTVDTLRKAVFHRLDEGIVNYHNIKLCTTVPVLAELNTNSKTIAQYQIKDGDKLILTAEYAFTFAPLPPEPHPNFSITLSGHTLSSTLKEVAKVPDPQTPIPLPAISEQPELPKKEQLTKSEEKKEEEKEGEGKEEVSKSKVEQEKVEDHPFHARCTAQYGSGRKYWQIKVDKMPKEEQQLLVGVCTKGPQDAEKNCWGCDEAWGYQLLGARKASYQRDSKTNSWQQDSESYGYIFKANDTVGVLLSFKGSIASVTFYKNSISCGEAFRIDSIRLKRQDKKLIPFVNIGGEGQVTLDSKAQYPIDSFRFR